MKKAINLLLVFSILIGSNTLVHAETPLSEMRVESDRESVKNIPKSDSLIAVPNGSTDNSQLKKHQEDDFEEDYKPSKWEITKNVAKYFAQKFVYDLKSYVKFYPLIQVAQFITYVAWFLPGYAIYKKTEFDVITSFSKFAANHQNFAIFAQNLYNAIPMTLASLIYKYGQQAFAYMRS